jgi:hypothetical protein
LVIRGVDDEASLTLAAGSIGSRLSSLVLFIVIPAIIFLAMLLIPLSGWLGANFLSSERRDFLYVLVLDGCAFGALALLFLPGVCKSAFGREFLTTAFVCEIASDSTPDTSSSTDVVTLSPVRAAEGKRLRHYIYDHPECVNEIVRWVGRVVKAG